MFSVGWKMADISFEKKFKLPSPWTEKRRKRNPK
jgi:hypothetical protein